MDLSVEGPEVSQAYLNCVYLGPETLEETAAAFRHAVLDSITGCPEINVYNVCKEVTTELLLEHFEEFGEIEEINISTLSATSASRYESLHVAYITYRAAEAGRAAIKASDSLILHGHQLTVEADDYAPEYELADLHHEAMIKLYVLADKLQDVVTANMVVDNIERFFNTTQVHPGKSPISAVYQSTVEGNPLRKLMRNVWFYDTRGACQFRLHESGFPNDFLHDFMKECVRVNVGIQGDNFNKFLDVASNDCGIVPPERAVPCECRYHQHDDEHLFCATRSSSKSKKPCRSCRPSKQRT